MKSSFFWCANTIQFPFLSSSQTFVHPFYYISNFAANVFHLSNCSHHCPSTLSAFCSIISNSVLFLHLQYNSPLLHRFNHLSSDILPLFFSFCIASCTLTDVLSVLFHSTETTSSRCVFISGLCCDAHKATSSEYLPIYRTLCLGTLIKHCIYISFFPLRFWCRASFFRLSFWRRNLDLNTCSENKQNIRSDSRTLEKIEYC